MENFILYNPVKLHFGKDITDDLAKTVELYGKRVLLVYGKNAIKENGVYAKIKAQLKLIHAEVFEYGGIKSNPVIEDVDAASRLGRNSNADVVLAVGGGSVIDSAKIISVTIPVSHSAWDFYSGLKKPEKAIPLIAVLTLAATGTEMNPYAVLQNHKSKQKIGWGHKLCFPKHSFLDPQFTLTVPKNYTAYGIADILAHCLEAYFGKGDATLSDKITIAIMKETIENGIPLLHNLKNYELREKILYSSTLALNGITMPGRKSGDWGVHDGGHVLSLLFDIPHGASLTIAYPAWMKLMKDRIPERITQLGKSLFDVDSPYKTIDKLEELFRRLDCPIKLSECNIDKENQQQILDTMIHNKVTGANHKLSNNDLSDWINFMY
ncbi:MAG TPA: iron-containing alcohol dehydrogenase [Bacteroidales bacterium]|nr:iron-containing alcohol dehydrogenase [Bacteroidales bacterium]HQH18683.1 iron-containing alcohol dehydrogenase [Bacteroidales bacterium]HQI45861.1 iron-containing alcohol dehydrogenase [Bacteroidales bacterium]